MSIRTLIEFNHDHAVHELETNPERAVADLLTILREYHDARSKGVPYSNSFTAKHQRHHSDDCPVDGQC